MAGAAGALLLQGVLLLLFLSSMPQIAPPAVPGRELVFTLPYLPRLQPLPTLPRAPAPASTQATPVPVPNLQAPAPLIAPPPAAAIPDLRNFGQALNGCAPEQYRNLTQEQKMRCIRPGAGVAMLDAPNLLGSPSDVKDEAHWQEEWAREKSPPLLPCGGFANIVCLLTKIADGSLSDYGDPSKWPHYAVKQLPPNDLYEIEQAYDRWHKDHPEARQTASDLLLPP